MIRPVGYLFAMRVAFQIIPSGKSQLQHPLVSRKEMVNWQCTIKPNGTVWFDNNFPDAVWIWEEQMFTNQETRDLCFVRININKNNFQF
jgi:hypothetical protein